MFAIPGVACLIVFVLARPQEFMPLLQRVPFLYLFTFLCALGWVIDVRLRRLQPLGTPALPVVLAFIVWAVICDAVVVPELLVPQMVELAILFTLYGTIAHGVQRFRTLQAIASAVVVTLLFVTFVCFHQGLSPKGCVAGQESEGEIMGRPDGRACDAVDRCYAPDGEPGMEYRCEHVGLFGTYSVQERVRYRGKLQDPNEVSLAITAGALSLLVAFWRRTRVPLSKLGIGLGILLVIATVFLSQSRGGLISMSIVIAVYAVRRWGLVALVPCGFLGLVVLALGGRSGEAADVSTQMRYEAWATGLELFRQHPLFGVGSGQFNTHHYLTAHNSFVLTLTETGFIGLFLFVSMLWVTIKSLIVGVRQLASVPGAEVAQVWGMALLASMIAITFQINTLSFAYHPVLWIFMGLVGAWCGAIRHHAPDFKTGMTWRDAVYVALVCLAYVFLILPAFLKYKGEM
jgi:O-antigen ligase